MSETQRAAMEERFRARFGRECHAAARAPGRVNLIGEHTDYNGGFVLPIAIGPATFVACAPRDDDRIHVRSDVIDADAEWPIGQWRANARLHWTSYVAGVSELLQARGTRLPGLDVLITGDLPVGGGLSSSAALEVACPLAFTQIAGDTLDARELIDLARTAEHDYVGVPCGIMDQSIVVLARAGAALLLDCRSREPEWVPFAPRSASVLVVDSGVRHELAHSEYAQRQTECRRAVEYFRTIQPGVTELRDVTSEMVRAHERHLDPLVAARARHVITEIERTLEAAERLRHNDIRGFGDLLYDSHRSLRDDYAVSCPELDRIVETLRKCDGVLGARMTGGGFGGCVVALVEHDALPAARAAVDCIPNDPDQRPITSFVTNAECRAERLNVP